MKRYYTLYSIVSAVIVFIVSMSVFINVAFTYMETKNEFIRDIKYNSHTSLEQLKQSISSYVESYSVAEYEKLIKNEMGHNDIYAIVVKDYNMGKILGEEYYITGKIRDEFWEIDNYSDKTILEIPLEDSFYIEKDDVLNKDGRKIAHIELYSSNLFLEKKLDSIILKGVYNFIIISLLLIVIFFFFMNLFILKPIKNIISLISNKDKNGIPIEYIPQKGSKEIIVLATTINKMVKLVRNSNSKLENMNKNLEVLVDEKTLELKRSIERLEKQKLEIEKAHLKFSSIYNSSLDAIFLINFEKDCFEDVNEKALMMYGYTKDEFLELTPESISAIYDKNGIKSIQKKIIQRGWDKFETRHKRKNSEIFDVFISAVSIELEGKDYLYVTARDITQEKEQKNQLEDLNQTLSLKVEGAVEEIRKKDRLLYQQSKMASMGEMLENIAHQWRQPLNALSATLFNIKLKYEVGKLNDTNMAQFTEKSSRLITKMNDTIDDFRNFFRPDKEKRDFNICQSIKGVMKIIDSSFINSQIEVEVNCDDSITCNGYKNELEQVLLVIFNNTKDVIKEREIENGKLSIDVIDEGNKLVVHICDNGGGVDKEILPRVFEPYFTTKHQDVGTGIGLYMSKMIIEDSMGGKISLENYEQGVRTTISLPKSESL